MILSKLENININIFITYVNFMSPVDSVHHIILYTCNYYLIIIVEYLSSPWGQSLCFGHNQLFVF